MKDLMFVVLWGKERQANTRQVKHRKSLRFVSGEWWAPLEGECDAACGGEAPLTEREARRLRGPGYPQTASAFPNLPFAAKRTLVGESFGAWIKSHHLLC